MSSTYNLKLFPSEAVAMRCGVGTTTLSRIVLVEQQISRSTRDVQLGLRTASGRSCADATPCHADWNSNTFSLHFLLSFNPRIFRCPFSIFLSKLLTTWHSPGLWKPLLHDISTMTGGGFAVIDAQGPSVNDARFIGVPYIRGPSWIHMPRKPPALDPVRCFVPTQFSPSFLPFFVTEASATSRYIDSEYSLTGGLSTRMVPVPLTSLQNARALISKLFFCSTNEGIQHDARSNFLPLLRDSHGLWVRCSEVLQAASGLTPSSGFHSMMLLSSIVAGLLHLHR